MAETWGPGARSRPPCLWQRLACPAETSQTRNACGDPRPPWPFPELHGHRDWHTQHGCALCPIGAKVRFCEQRNGEDDRGGMTSTATQADSVSLCFPVSAFPLSLRLLSCGRRSRGLEFVCVLRRAWSRGVPTRVCEWAGEARTPGVKGRNPVLAVFPHCASPGWPWGSLAEAAKLQEGTRRLCGRIQLVAGRERVPSCAPGRHWDTCCDRAGLWWDCVPANASRRVAHLHHAGSPAHIPARPPWPAVLTGLKLVL